MRGVGQVQADMHARAHAQPDQVGRHAGAQRAEGGEIHGLAHADQEGIGGPGGDGVVQILHQGGQGRFAVPLDARRIGLFPQHGHALVSSHYAPAFMPRRG
ncbi:hypothetical protein AZA_75417 [Nitrospirillum viridazoti Y2]|nr:hypothetical protein AZA_75417 [Nitrospirillum amazonense Y2]